MKQYSKKLHNDNDDKMDAGYIYAPYIPIMFSDSTSDVLAGYTIPNDMFGSYKCNWNQASFGEEEEMSYVNGTLNYKSKLRDDDFVVGYNAAGKFGIFGVYNFTLEQAHASIPHKHNYETH